MILKDFYLISPTVQIYRFHNYLSDTEKLKRKVRLLKAKLTRLRGSENSKGYAISRWPGVYVEITLHVINEAFQTINSSVLNLTEVTPPIRSLVCLEVRRKDRSTRIKLSPNYFVFFLRSTVRQEFCCFQLHLLLKSLSGTFTRSQNAQMD